MANQGVTQGRVQSIEESVNRLRERMSEVTVELSVLKEKRDNNAKIAAATLLTGLVIAYASWLGSQVVTLKTDVAGLTTKVGDLQTFKSISILDDASRKAAAGDQAAAKEELDTATQIWKQHRNSRVSAGENDFQRASGLLDSIASTNADLGAAVNAAYLTLAEYRSSLHKTPTLTGKEVTVARATSNEDILKQLEGQSTILKAATPDTQFFNVTPPDGNVTASHIVFSGGKQPLDGLNLKDVIFVGTEIRYEGKLPATLEGVSFVNCTFVASSTPVTRQLYRYAAVQPLTKVTLEAS